ncbi:syndecan-like isoform X1 [Contarinia nasturtii]|uniref:syndecan-like isoform X1 n=1 Tax=Contarinia nasturtii TaxID=265458 RepID=UPI0012D46914|nr:syndecan-like isoform X1 [Contarinia nasturtii]XP_031630829.1 syndecan-like isoform X1 [Contarinia nasturtii]
MSTILNNVSTSLIILAVIILTFDSQSGAFATEQKPESLLWQISSTQTPKISTVLSSINTSTSIGSTTSSTDAILPNDEGLEGSGGRGEIHDDLEKEPEYSGSGFGPDDEDSSSSTTHHRKKGGYKSNTGNSGYKPINSKNKESTPEIEINKQTEKPTFPIDTIDEDQEQGSGKGDDIDGDDTDEFDQKHRIVPDGEGEGENGGNNVLIPSGKPDLNNHGNPDDGDGDDDLITEIDNTDDISIDKPSSETDTDLSYGEQNEIDLDKTGKSDTSTGKPSSGIEQSHTPTGNEVFIMDNRPEDRTTSFFAQPGILAAVIGGAVVGLLCAILVVMFIVYRMRKKDEGSYALDEPKRSPAVNSYAKNANNREFYA